MGDGMGRHISVRPAGPFGAAHARGSRACSADGRTRSGHALRMAPRLPTFPRRACAPARQAAALLG